VIPYRRLAFPPISPSRRRVLIGLGVMTAVVLWTLIVALAAPYDWSKPGTGHDARAYWTAVFEYPYATSQVGANNAYLYSPAYLQLIAPLRGLPWQAFMAGWTLVLIVAALYLVGPVLLGGALILALPEILGGNITLLIATAIVLGFRWPGAWSFVLLTKVTPGVGLLWFGVRREWRALGIALAFTVAVVLVSWLFAPVGVWSDWFRVLLSNANQPIESGSLPVPLWMRLPLAVVVIVWAAMGNRRWAMPIGCLLALPVIWYGSLSLLIAIVPLVRIPRVREWLWEPITRPLAQRMSEAVGRELPSGSVPEA
jgi:hypothetical protein